MEPFLAIVGTLGNALSFIQWINFNIHPVKRISIYLKFHIVYGDLSVGINSSLKPKAKDILYGFVRRF
ncbi:hypothetical protein ES705_01169 [subsurface metagenome]|nr:hypothetical protein [Clostridia bacterium]